MKPKNLVLILIRSFAPSEFVNTELAAELLRGTLHAVHVSVESVEFLNVAASVLHKKRKKSGSLRTKSERTAPPKAEKHAFVPESIDNMKTCALCGADKSHANHYV